MPLAPQDRKAELVRRRKKITQIAQETGYSQPYVSDVIAGNRRSARIEQAVADAIGMPVNDVFPPREDAA